MVEGKCPPVHEIYWENGEMKHRWYYPEPDPDYVDPETYETDGYSIEDKDEFYGYVTVCKSCGTRFQAFDKKYENIRSYCPGCGRSLE